MTTATKPSPAQIEERIREVDDRLRILREQRAASKMIINGSNTCVERAERDLALARQNLGATAKTEVPLDVDREAAEARVERESASATRDLEKATASLADAEARIAEHGAFLQESMVEVNQLTRERAEAESQLTQDS